MTIDEMIAVLQAAKAGKQIQCQENGLTYWMDVDDPTWNFYRRSYRVKPEPREWEMYEEAGRVWPAHVGVDKRRTFKVREVLE